MKTKLLSLCALIFLTFSCSVDPVIDTQVNEKREIVKKTMQYVYKIGQTPSYHSFVKELKTKSADSDYTEEEINRMIDDFIAEQSPEFVALYYMLLDLDLPEDQLLALALELRAEIIGNDNLPDNKLSCDSDQGGYGSFATLVIAIFCGENTASRSEKIVGN